MTDQAKPTPRPWRRFLRFSVRGLIVVVLVIGVWLGWIVRQAHVQRDAVAVIQRSGGDVFYQRDMPKWRPNWLVDRMGVDYFDHIESVTFYEECSDAELAYVGRLSGLRELYLAAQSGPDGPLFRVNVTDAGLVHLKGLTKLYWLGLGGSRVTDAGLAHLTGLTSLEELDLAGTHVTDDGLAHLNGLTKLSSLDLRNTQVSDAGLVHLMALTKLSRLGLHDTHVTDAGLIHLRGLSKLSGLDLGFTRVTDGGLGSLKALKNLLNINLVGTRVTDAGENDLRQAIPSLTIFR